MMYTSGIMDLFSFSSYILWKDLERYIAATMQALYNFPESVKLIIQKGRDALRHNGMRAFVHFTQWVNSRNRLKTLLWTG